MSGWQRASQAHIVFWFGTSLVFGMTRRIVRDIILGRSWVNNQVSRPWQKTGDPASLGTNGTIVRDTGQRPGRNYLDTRSPEFTGPARCLGTNRTIVRVMPRRRYWCFFINFFIFNVDI